MKPWTLIWGAADWLAIAAAIAAVLLLLLVWGYWRAGASRGLRVLAGALKALGILILVACLMEPLISGARARPGANVFVLLADNSQSMTLRDAETQRTRGETLKGLVPKTAPWLSQLREDFDLHQYGFDTQLRSLTAGVEELDFAGPASHLGNTLDRLVRRYHGRPLAGVLLFTDGSATDAEALERMVVQQSVGGTKLPPIYPVLVGSEKAIDDVSVDRITVTQTNFEDAPVTLAAQATASGYRGRNVVAQLIDESGKPLQQQVAKVDDDGKPIAVRFQLRPEQSGVSFYRVRVAAEDQLAQFDDPAKLAEATLANNSRIVAVDRGKGPYRVLYVTGRPNWEFKFLNRAVASDDQVNLVGLLRIARKEPKFTFLGRVGESSNPLFRGFEAPDKDQIESYDQPVIVRFNTEDEQELRGGFPQAAEDLYKYHAIILDDLESEFFTQDQMLLVKEFVRQRGGGLLMLGGQESFKNGKYDRTPIGDLLPVYADEVPAAPAAAVSSGPAKYRLELTREGLLEPWVRLRAEEDAERKRLAAMPGFQTLNQIRGIKPGATVLARAAFENGTSVPALVEQRFGAGRVGAMLIGDLWRWGLRRAPDAEDDLPKAWRQTIRWLVADVPQRVEVSLPPREKGEAEQPEGAVTVSVNVRDSKYAPLDNAAVTVRVTGPDGNAAQLTAEPSAKKAGVYEATYVPRQGGAYRAEVIASAPDGSEIARVPAGWTHDPAAEEFRQLRPNRELLDRVARATGGQLVAQDDLSNVVATFPTRHAEITEPYIRPMWHQPLVFLLVIACLAAEWGLRRIKGMP